MRRLHPPAQPCQPAEQFVSEPLEPLGRTFDTALMAAGGPGSPKRFRWRKQEYSVARVLETWKTVSKCRHGSADLYVRKHWFKLVTSDGTRMTLYFERQPKIGANRKNRWWVLTVSVPSGPIQ